VETSATVENPRELPIVARQLALDFANTIDDPEGAARHDHLATYPGLLQWSVRVGALSPAQAERLQQAATSEPRRAAAALKRAHALRRTILATFTEIAAGESPAPRHWAQLRPFVTDAVAHAQLIPTAPAYQLGWPDTDQLHAMLWPIAHAALELLTAAELHRVKRCAGCPWLFLDHSKNTSRRWCAMNDCGTHAKVRRYVARRAARRTRSQ
jgi:predicted RNA-binding Zn ribbon-like protein